MSFAPNTLAIYLTFVHRHTPAVAVATAQSAPVRSRSAYQKTILVETPTYTHTRIYEIEF